MLKEKEWEIEGGKLTYLEGEDGITVTGCKVNASRVAVPDEIGKVPVTRIDRKAFLSRKQLKEIRLPKGLLEIGDWAFAYCSGLTFVWMPKRNLSMGKGVFKDCQALSGIFPLEGETVKDRQCGMLLGSVPMKLETEYLFTPGDVGSGQWLCAYDAKVHTFLEQPDEDGYSKMVYCGEEDIMSNMDLYLAERRREKARLCLLRLINPVGLSENFRQELEGYLREHTKGCDSQAAWEVVFFEHGSEQEYYEAFTGAGCVTEENYDRILSDMGEQYPEMKGFLMRYRSEKMEQTDFFAALTLDL